MIVKVIELYMQHKRKLEYLSPYVCFVQVLEWTIAMKMLPKNKLDLKKKYLVSNFYELLPNYFVIYCYFCSLGFQQ